MPRFGWRDHPARAIERAWTGRQFFIAFGSRRRELRGLGVTRLSLFGCVARGDAGAGSDVDFAAEFDPARRIGLFRYAALRERIEDCLGIPVDLISEPVEKPRLRAQIDRDRVHVF